LACASARGQGTNAAKEWSFELSGLGYLIPNGRSYISPALSADRGSLHLEARYNYENFETGSIWAGRNFSFGSKTTFAVTPMIGGVFGTSSGIAVGYLATFQHRRLSIDSQGEYLFATNQSGSFFYNWSEISYSAAEWFRAGVVIQRTKAYHTRLEVEPGLLAGVSRKNVDFTIYVFDPTVVLGIGWRF